MKVTLAKRGGHLAAINLRRPPLVVDSDAVPKSSAEELTRLVAAARAVPATQEKVSGIPGDVMTYTITVEEGGAVIVLKQSDIAMSPAFSALLGWLENHATGR
jgi:hypothetical protein